VRNPNDDKAQALRQAGGTVTTVAEALGTDPQVILLAVPGGAMEATITANAAQLDGRTIIDAANRMGGGGPTDSLAILQQQTPNAKIYRAFNTLGWENFANPTYNGVQGDLLYAGPEGDSLAQVEQLIRDVGLRPMHVGGTDQIATVDGLLGLWFSLMKTHGRHVAFKVLTD
jgi:8-hydroxy-5-deazaflavin:NADPH oxidoreductase